MKADTKALSNAAAALRTHAHGQWVEFVKAFQGYCDRTVDECLAAPPAELAAAQARAAQARALLEIITRSVPQK